jgi:GT2 family glycosyltransferase
MLAFILLASRLGRPVAASDVAKCTRYDMAELAFEPDQYLGWHSNDRRLYLFAWQAFSEQGQVGSHWHVDRDEVVLFSGMPIPLDTPWAPGVSWADQIAERIAAADANTVAAELGGAFTLLHLQPEADSLITNDLLGGAPLYWDASQEILIVSNRANLVASLWHPVRDWRGPAWSAFAGEPLDSDTGFKDVAALSRGEWWDLGWKKRPEKRARPLPAAAGNPIAQIEMALRRSLRATASLPFQRVTLALDRGKASRLLLALAADEGLLGRIALTTTGDLEEPGVQTAVELADRVGRPLLLQTRSLTDPGEFLQQARISAFQSSGLSSAWDLGGALGADDLLRIEPNLAGALAPTSRQRAILTGKPVFDPSGVLEPVISSFFADRIATRLGDPASWSIETAIALVANPRSIAAAVETPTIAHAYPYLDPAIWAALAALPVERLLDDTVYTTIMERTAPELLAIPSCDELGPGDGRMAHLDELLAVFEDYLLDTFNPLQDLVDSETVTRLLADPNRSLEDTRTLFALLSVAIWLGHDEQELRVHRADEMEVRGVYSPLDYKEQLLLGDESLLPRPDTALRNRATDQLLDNWLKLDEPGMHLTSDAKILGIIPYYEAEAYLEAAVESLVKQSRPLDGIVVIDDCSSTPPTELLNKFPTVTLLRAQENSRPFRLIQEVIDHTGYDAYLFEDSDDWSSPNRLEVLLDLAARTGKELIGSQGHRLIVDEGEVVLYEYPLDPDQAIATNPTSKPVHHPTSLVTRDLIQRTGGFCTGLPFSGDTEFLRRAATIGPIANTPEFIYVYRTRSDSLTGSEETGVHTAIRRDLWAIQHPRAKWIADRVSAGLGPILAPMAVTSPATLTHLSGPALLGVDGQPWPAGIEQAATLRELRKPAIKRKNAASLAPRPVFVIGAPRSGASILALAIAQLPTFKLTLDPTWLTNLSSALHLAFTSAEEDETVTDLEMQLVDSEQFAAHFGVAAHELLLRGVDPSVSAPSEDDVLRQLRTSVTETRTRVLAEGDRLAEHGFELHRLFPHAKFIHVMRDPDEVVAAHQEDRRSLYRSRFVQMNEERAYNRWIEVVQAARDLEIALGAQKVMRVDRAAMMADPETTLRRTIAFIDEVYDPIVLRPFA